MGAGLVLLTAAVLLAAWGALEWRALLASPHGSIVAGSHATLLRPTASSPTLEWLRTIGQSASEPMGAPTEPEASPGGTRAPDPTRSSDLAAAGIAGGLELAAGGWDWWHLDSRVPAVFEQWTHQEVHNRLDLMHTLSEHNYRLGTAGFVIKLRGHVAEQDVYDQLHHWAGSQLEVPDASNNPASDLTLGGHEFNIKVGPTSDTIREHLSNHPGIPVIVNSDMANLPADAFHVDLTQPIDPDLLASHSVVVADGLTLGHIHDQMADALGPALHGFDLHDALDTMSDLGIPVLGSAIRVVRSGIREQRLAQEHGNTGRALKNVGKDVAIVGGGVAAGGAVGAGLGLLLDIATGGLTGGVGTVAGKIAGAAIGGWLGNKEATEQRMQPLLSAQAKAGDATIEYDAAVAAATQAAESKWQQTVSESQSRLDLVQEELDARVREVFHDLEGSLSEQRTILDQQSADLLTRTTEQDHRPWGILAYLRARRWRLAGAAACDAQSRADVLLAHKRGAPQVREITAAYRDRCEGLVARAVASGVNANEMALAARVSEIDLLRAARADLEMTVRREVHPQLLTVWETTNVVRDELHHTGAKPKEWVEQNLPRRPRPTIGGPSTAA